MQLNLVGMDMTGNLTAFNVLDSDIDIELHVFALPWKLGLDLPSLWQFVALLSEFYLMFFAAIAKA